MNRKDKTRLPNTSNAFHEDALEEAKLGNSPNNISPILTYSLKDGATIMWMGDLERDFMSNVQDTISLPEADILFAPHHGRESGKVPSKWLGEINPKIVVIGEAPSTSLNYYPGFDTITQKSAGDITFDCQEGAIHILVPCQITWWNSSPANQSRILTEIT